MVVNIVEVTITALKGYMKLEVKKLYRKIILRKPASANRIKSCIEKAVVDPPIAAELG